MYVELIMGVITPYSGTTSANKNGDMPVMVQLLAGKMPNRNTIDGTVAKRAGFEVGKTYLIQVRERGEDLVHGAQFNWLNAGEVTSAVEKAQMISILGKPEVIMYDKPEVAKEYNRQSNAVESITTQRIKEGLFRPSLPTNPTHENAKIKQGSSTEGYSVEETKKLDQKALQEDKNRLTRKELSKKANESFAVSNSQEEEEEQK